MTEYDPLKYGERKALVKAAEHAEAFVRDWNRAKFHDCQLEDAFQAWRDDLKLAMPSVDVMLRAAPPRNPVLFDDGRNYDLIVFLANEALAAIADTHPKDGDVEQAPLVSGGGAGTAIAHPSPSPIGKDKP